MPIGTNDVNIMLIMLSMLLLLPLGFFSIYKNDHRRIVPVYMGGENAGDNKAFNGALGKTRKLELRNWYMEKYFGSAKLTYWSDTLCAAILCVSVIMLVLGVMGL